MWSTWQVAACNANTACVTEDGTLYTMGHNAECQLGHGERPLVISTDLILLLFGFHIISPLLDYLLVRHVASQNLSKVMWSQWNALGEEMGAVGPRYEQVIGLTHSAFNDVSAYGTFSLRANPPFKQITNACRQGIATISMRCPTKVWHNWEALSSNFYLFGVLVSSSLHREVSKLQTFQD